MMIIRAIDTCLDVREFEVSGDDTDEKARESATRAFVDDLARGVWPEDIEGWRISPVHIMRLKVK